MRKLIFALGILIFMYPTVSDWWNSFHQSQVISRYEEKIDGISQEEYDTMWEAAQRYNKDLAKQTVFTALSEKERERYHSMLSVFADGMMGYIEIPSIGCRLPLYHGTEEAVLQQGAGHMDSSSLPIGGIDSHSVISGHRGLPSSLLFSRLDQLKEGDIFRIQILNRTISYQVSQIQVVLPEETESLRIVQGKDLCTLVTCTPYGVNSHRLLVQGRRAEEKKGQGGEGKEMDSKGGIQLRTAEFAKWAILCILILMFMISSDQKVYAAEKESYHILIQYSFENVEFRLYRKSLKQDEEGIDLTELGTPVQIVRTNEAGEASFENLPAGNYVIKGMEHQIGDWLYQPAVSEVELPESFENGIKKIVIRPKYEKEQYEEPETEIEEEVTNTEEDRIYPDGNLPQTGQVWMPVFIIAMFGGLLLLLGLRIQKK